MTYTQKTKKKFLPSISILLYFVYFVLLNLPSLTNHRDMIMKQRLGRAKDEPAAIIGSCWSLLSYLSSKGPPHCFVFRIGIVLEFGTSHTTNLTVAIMAIFLVWTTYISIL